MNNTNKTEEQTQTKFSEDIIQLLQVVNANLPKYRQIKQTDFENSQVDFLEILRGIIIQDSPDLTQKHIFTLIKQCPEDEQEQCLTLLLESVESNPEFFEKLVNAKFLAKIAYLTTKLCAFIFFNNETCTEIFENDIENFPNYFLPLCKKQTRAIYYAIYHHRNTSELFLAVKRHANSRVYLTELLSHYDQFVPTGKLNKTDQEVNNYVGSFAPMSELITGNDDVINFKIICKSKILALKALNHVLSRFKLIPKDISENKINLDVLVEIAKMHPDLSYVIVDTLLENFGRKFATREKKICIMNELLPLVRKSTTEESKLTLSKLSFTGVLESVPKDREKALRICLKLLDSDMKKPEVFKLLLTYAQAYRTGKWHLFSVEKDLGRAFVLYEYIKTKSIYTTQIQATKDLHLPSFIFEYGIQCETNGNLDVAFEIYSFAHTPVKPTINPSFDCSKEMSRYSQEILFKVQVLNSQFLLICKVLDQPATSPKTTLKIAQDCINRKEVDAANCLLIAMQTNVKEELLTKKYWETCLELGKTMFSLGQHNSANTIFLMIPSSVFSMHKEARNYLKYSGQNELYMDESASEQKFLSETEKNSIRLAELEMVHKEITELLSRKDCQYYFTHDNQDQHRACETALAGLTATIKVLQHQLRESLTADQIRTSWVNQRASLSPALQAEIAKGIEFKDSKEPRKSISQHELLLKRYLRFNTQTSSTEAIASVAEDSEKAFGLHT